MTIEEKLKEALLTDEEFYINTPTFDNFIEFISLCKNYFKEYVPNMNFEIYTYDMWDIYKENTCLFYWKNDNFFFGGKRSINNKDRWFLDLFNLGEIIEHTYTISIGEYSGKLIIPKEALELLKNGNKIKIV